MNKREAEIKDQIASAAKKSQEADRRLEDLRAQDLSARQDRERLLSEARSIADRERAEIIRDARSEADRIVRQAKERAEQEWQSAIEKSQSEIAHAAVQIASNLVGRIAARQMHEALVTRLVEALGDPTNPDGAVEPGAETAKVRTALELTDKQIELLTAAIQSRAGTEASVQVELNPALVAGCQVLTGSRLIDLTLQALVSQIESESTNSGADS